MKTIGIIAEYNPLHNGHVYHFNKVKEESKADIVVLSLSPSFTQRGDISIMNKFDKTRCALEMGVDIVLECPSLLSMQDATRFCYFHVLNLSRCNVDEIWIGSELNDPKVYEEFDKLVSCDIFQNIEQKYLSQGYSPKLSFNKALAELKLENLMSNDQLGLFYYQAIQRVNPNIKLKTIKRINNDYNDETLNSTPIQSATAIRANLKKSKNYLPSYSQSLIDNAFDEELLLPFIKYNVIVTRELKTLIEATEGIENRLKLILTAKNINEAVEILESKRYSKSKIKRLLIDTAFNLTKNDLELSRISFQYMRVLGFSNKGQEYISSLKKYVKLYTNIKDNQNAALDIELRITKGLDLIYNTNMFKQEQKGPLRPLNEKEKKNRVVKK